jgi:energy-coupling factor transport system substrate-specific component
MNSRGLTTRDITVMGFMVALLEVSVHAMAAIPNVEPVTLLVMLYTLFFGTKVFYILAAYLLLELCFYGFGIWWLSYLYVWPLLAIVTYRFRAHSSVWFYAVLAAAFGLLFGALCTIPYIFLSGISGAFAWWVAGIPYDVIHCVANFIMCAVFFEPLRYSFRKLMNK